MKKKSKEERNGHGVGNDDNTDKKTIRVQSKGLALGVWKTELNLNLASGLLL